jgi:hypothetical protein
LALLPFIDRSSARSLFISSLTNPIIQEETKYFHRVWTKVGFVLLFFFLLSCRVLSCLFLAQKAGQEEGNRQSGQQKERKGPPDAIREICVIVATQECRNLGSCSGKVLFFAMAAATLLDLLQIPGSRARGRRGA